MLIIGTGSSSPTVKRPESGWDFQKAEIADLDAQFAAIRKESVEEEVIHRLAARGIAIEVEQTDIGQQQIHGRDNLMLTSRGNHSVGAHVSIRTSQRLDFRSERIHAVFPFAYVRFAYEQ